MVGVELGWSYGGWGGVAVVGVELRWLGWSCGGWGGVAVVGVGGGVQGTNTDTVVWVDKKAIHK